MSEEPVPPVRPDLGPFRPPSSLEPEFHAPPPRPIPEALRGGRYEHKRRTALFFGAFFAGSSFLAWVLSRGTTLDEYFLALPWFHWIAAGSAALTLLAAIVQQVRPGLYAYVRDGVPMPARVLDLRLVVAATANGVPSAYRYVCVVEYQAPGETSLRQGVVASPEFSEMFKKSTYTPLRVGDYATAVALPGRLEATLALYGFLQLSPDRDFLRRRGREGGPGHPAATALLYVGLVYLFLGLFLAITCLPSLLPLGFPDRVDPRVAVPGASIVALAGAVLTWRFMRAREERQRAELQAENDAARLEGRAVEEFAPMVGGGVYRALLVLAGALLPPLVLAVALSGVNALLDRSEPRYEPVAIKDFRHKTTLALFRRYEVRYVRSDGGTETIAVPVTELARFARLSPDEGAIDRRLGYFGWPWVRGVYPLVRDAGGRRRVLLPDGRDPELPDRLSFPVAPGRHQLPAMRLRRVPQDAGVAVAGADLEAAVVGGEPTVEDLLDLPPAARQPEAPRRLLAAVARVALDADKERRVRRDG